MQYAGLRYKEEFHNSDIMMHMWVTDNDYWLMEVFQFNCNGIKFEYKYDEKTKKLSLDDKIRISPIELILN